MTAEIWKYIHVVYLTYVSIATGNVVVVTCHKFEWYCSDNSLPSHNTLTFVNWSESSKSKFRWIFLVSRPT